MEYVRNVYEDIYQNYSQEYKLTISQANQQMSQLAAIQRNQQEQQQLTIQEYQQMYQQAAIQRNLQNNLRNILDKFNANINMYESLAFRQPDEEHNYHNTCRVKEAIGEDYKKWNNIEPVFIDAPTGSGKTSFVYERLIPDAISNGHGVLIVSNRIALSRQQKLEVYDIVTDPKYKHLLEGFNLEDLKREEINNEIYMIGPVCVTTYQGLFSLFNPDVSAEIAFNFTSQKLYNAEKLRKWSETIRYAVFDEIHIIYADAEFNSFCSEFLRGIPFIFRDVVRVYMTATSYEVIDYIRKYEICKYSMNAQNPPHAQFMDQQSERKFNWIEAGPNVKAIAHPRLIRYTINPDYSRYELKFFSTERMNEDSDENTGTIEKKVASVINILNPLPNEHNKAIIFVDNKKVGKKIFDSLKRKGVSAALLTKDISTPKDAREKIILNERFDELVLITTQVLDSGVNIKDKSVKNIIIFYTDRTQFIQSLGRKRLEEDEGNVTVWAFVPDKKSFYEKAKNYISDANSAIKLLNSYCNVPGYEPIKFAQKHLADRHYELFKKFKCDSYPNYAYMFRLIYNDKPRISTLIYADYNATIRTNIYVLGVILGKIEYLKQFVYPDDNGTIKDYREEVCEWLGKQNVIDEIKEKRKEPLNYLENELSNNIGKEMQDKEFKHIRKIITKTYIDYFPKGKLSGRTDDYINSVGRSVLNDLLEELGLDFAVNVERKNGNGKIKTQHTWIIEKKTDIPQTPKV